MQSFSMLSYLHKKGHKYCVRFQIIHGVLAHMSFEVDNWWRLYMADNLSAYLSEAKHRLVEMFLKGKVAQ